jgi:hypothetical protein
MQNQITETIDLLDEKGRIARPGYATKMNYRFNRNAVKAHFFALKEWDFYQVDGGDWVLQLTIGHVSYVASFSATLFNVRSGERATVSRMRALPLRNMPMPLNPEQPYHLEAKAKDFFISYDVTHDKRVLSVKAQDKKTGIVDVNIELANDVENEKMVIATPFVKPKQFYLNYKENYYRVSGQAVFGKLKADFDSQYTALLDWGRGVWPFKHQWFWGNGTGLAEDGKRFGFNIGWGFGDTSNATENMFFYEGKAYKLGVMQAELDENDYMRPWRFKTDDGLFDFTMTPVYDRYSENNVASIVKTACHQIFGMFNGTAILPGGRQIKVKNFLAFCEHAKNRW